MPLHILFIVILFLIYNIKEVSNMARGRRRIAEKRDYDDLIAKSKDKIEKLTADLKAEKIALKELEKDKVAYEKQKALEETTKKQEELMDIIKKSGKTPDEIRALLFPDGGTVAEIAATSDPEEDE